MKSAQTYIRYNYSTRKVQRKLQIMLHLGRNMLVKLTFCVLVIFSLAQSKQVSASLRHGSRRLYANPEVVPQGSTVDFAVLAGTAVTNEGKSDLKGDLGVFPGTTASGFPPGKLDGDFHLGDDTAGAALGDLTTAKNNAASRAYDQTISADMAGLTLSPGVYFSAGTMAVTGGTLTLDANGDSKACWIFQIGSTLTIGTYSKVVITGGNGKHNVFWNVGSSAEIKTGSSIVGTVMAGTGIAVGTGATTGPLLAYAGEVTLIDNDVRAYGYNDSPVLTSGEIAGIVIGGVVALILLGLLIFFCCYGWAALAALVTCQSCMKNPETQTVAP